MPMSGPFIRNHVPLEFHFEMIILPSGVSGLSVQVLYNIGHLEDPPWNRNKRILRNLCKGTERMREKNVSLTTGRLGPMCHPGLEQGCGADDVQESLRKSGL